MRPRPFVFVTAVASLAITCLIAAIPSLHFVYRRPDIALAIDSIATLVGTTAAYLVLQRFVRTRGYADLLLASALAIFGGTSLLFGVVPQVTGFARLAHWGTGAVATGRLLGACLLVIAALSPGHRRFSRNINVATALSVGIAVMAGIAACGALMAASLPEGLDPTLVDARLIPEGSGRPGISFDPRVLVLYLPAVLLNAVAAVGFMGRAESTGDGLLKWVAAGAVLRAVASLNYFLFPAVHETYAYTGDGFRLAFYVFLLIGAAKEMRRNWRDRELEMMKTQFLSNVSHEMRTPLVPILGYIPLLKAGNIEPRRLRSVADDIEQAGHRLARITSLLVDYSLLEAGRIEVRNEIVDLRNLIQSLVDELDAGPEERLKVNVDPAVPDLVGNATLMHRSIIELVDNARKFSSEASDISIDVRSHESDITIAVSDKGPGMSAETLGRIGGEFEQGDGSSTRTHGGLGLGLAFTRRIVEEMGGFMSIHSRPGIGTTVTLTLPARDTAR